jgi:hypothetical protein
MGALPVGTYGYRLRANAAGSFEILGECRQSGALFAAEAKSFGRNSIDGT